MTKPLSRPKPPALRCSCGEAIRLVRMGGVEFGVDEEPVPGGDLLINVDHVVARLSPRSTARTAQLAFRMHRCPAKGKS